MLLYTQLSCYICTSALIYANNREKVPFMKLLDRVSTKIKFKHYSLHTEKSYISWIKQFILFHNKTHPENMGKFEIEQFLTHLVTQRSVSASTQN